ncbi:glucokinase, partial [Burkholderia sp. SIMBA_057]
MSTGVQTKAVPGAGQHADGPRLLADIGGTNARFALENSPGEIGSVQVYPCADYPGVAEVIKKYLKDTR